LLFRCSIMIEITPTTPKKEEKKEIKQKKRTSFVRQKDKSFTATLQRRISFEFQGTLEELMEELKNQEKNFLQKQNDYELNRYKAIVQKVLKLILDEGFQTKTLKRLRKDRADFIIVKDINLRLLNISKYITGNRNKAFNLLKEIEEIRGLILDLLQ
jgi:uncharacterized protein YaaR (DUF327 family)